MIVMQCEMSQKLVLGFSKFSHKVNARFERKAKLLTGGRHLLVKNLLIHLANLPFGEGGDER